MKQYLTILPLALVFAVSLGCGPKLPPGMPKLYHVTATVIFEDGKPVGGAQVIFRLTDPVLVRTWLHAGTTDSEGKVKLMTDGEYIGIPAGKYSVTIEKFETEKQDVTPPPIAIQSAQGNGPGSRPPSPPPIPSRGTVIQRFQLVEDDYLDHARTPLKDIEVKAGTNEVLLSAGKEQRISKPLRPGGGTL
jgi:hypothetical protein